MAGINILKTNNFAGNSDIFVYGAEAREIVLEKSR